MSYFDDYDFFSTTELFWPDILATNIEEWLKTKREKNEIKELYSFVVKNQIVVLSMIILFNDPLGHY